MTIGSALPGTAPLNQLTFNVVDSRPVLVRIRKLTQRVQLVQRADLPAEAKLEALVVVWGPKALQRGPATHK